ncbi:hypothetical protein [Pseudomonas libanensis]|nr:hypothetical protein [Pseudomonas libanensis]
MTRPCLLNVLANQKPGIAAHAYQLSLLWKDTHHQREEKHG